MLHLGTCLCLGFFDAPLHLVQQATFALFAVGATAGRDLPDHRAALMFFAFLNAGVPRVATDDIFLAVQQTVDLGDIGNVGGGTHYVVNQPHSLFAPICAFMPKKY